MTGGDRVSARFMRQDFFEYDPQFKLLIAGNHKPGLRSVDEAMRRRLHFIPFAVTIPKEERDLRLKEKLKAEWPGILTWMIEGCLDWQQNGLRPPASVRAATDAYLDGEDTLAAWLRLTLLPGVGTAGQRSLLKAFGSPEAVFEASVSALASVIGAELARVVGDHPTAAAVETSLAWAQEPQHHLLPLGHPRYPAALLDIPDPPSLLYGKGNLDALNPPGLAVVGSRNATAGGLQTAERFARALADCGYTVVSGLALGIDAAAHLGALASGQANATIAVIGTGIDRVYPARNQALARRIVDEGSLILSEFALGVGVQAHHFPRRNRLIAGLAKGVLVVEAAVQSGSLITARLAGEQGREVFAIPGSIHSAQSKGCHRLIKEGAKLVESAADILDEIGRPTGAAAGMTVDAGDNFAAPPLFGNSLLDALGGDPLTVDELVKRCDLTADGLLAMLFELEMAGRVAALPGGRYQRLG